MIAFACKKCGKRDSRPESQAGTLVFCVCGQSNRVPWSSEGPSNPLAPIPLPSNVPASVPMPAARPRQVPVLDAEPASSASPRSVPKTLPPEPAPSSLDAALASRRAGRLIGKVNPKFCFQHDDLPSELTCSACKLPFCASCIIEQQGQPLCGPCKNFRLAALGRPERVLPLAVLALVVSLAGGPVGFILSLVGVGQYRGEGMTLTAIVLCLLASILPVGSLWLSRRALLRIDSQSNAGGRSLAVSAASISLVELLWCAGVAALVIRQSTL